MTYGIYIMFTGTPWLFGIARTYAQHQRTE